MADLLPPPASSGPAPDAPPLAGLEHRLAERRARVGVAGLGAVGLPLAELLHRAGFRVTGVDPDPELRAQLAAGRAPKAHQAHLDLERLAGSARFEAVAEPRLGAEPLDALVICVPTDLDAVGRPDLACVRAALEAALPCLAPEALVVLESTTWPGTTREVLGAALTAAGRRLGRDTALAFSPERVDPGRPELGSIPKLVGGLDGRQGDLAAQLYRGAFADVRQVEGPEVAEAAKLLENVYRAVNIALVNELKGSLERLGVDIWQVLDAAATKPFGFQRFDPGPGVGGHCIPVDPSYLTWVARQAGMPLRLVELAGEINASMPARVAQITGRALEARGTALEGARLLLLGVAYKPNVDGLEHAPALELARELDRAGASVRYHDALVPSLSEAQGELRSILGARSLGLDARTLAAFDGVLLVTPHGGLDLELVAEHARLVVDTRGALRERLLGDPRYVPA